MEHRPTPDDRTGIHPDDCDCGGVLCEQDRADKLAGDPIALAACCAESPSPSCCPQCGSRGYCLPTCSWYPKVKSPCCAECAFEDDWERAPATVKRLVERNDAFYWWRQGRQSVKGVGGE